MALFGLKVTVSHAIKTACRAPKLAKLDALQSLHTSAFPAETLKYPLWKRVYKLSADSVT